ncbi:hypothetical protein C8J56DRAFT_892002 [Mycena floridula]|nr:hypothetical protein C8J56DRAFT_892002 [Mycena floridula]
MTQDNVWDVYLFISGGFCHLDDHVVDPFTPECNASVTLGREDQWDDDALPLIPDEEWGLNGGLGPASGNGEMLQAHHQKISELRKLKRGLNVAAQFSNDGNPAPKWTYEWKSGPRVSHVQKREHIVGCLARAGLSGFHIVYMEKQQKKVEDGTVRVGSCRMTHPAESTSGVLVIRGILG